MPDLTNEAPLLDRWRAEREASFLARAVARGELGLNPDDLGSPWGAALYSFIAFTAGAILPLLPFLLRLGSNAVLVASAMAGVALFAVGAALSLFSGRGALPGGLRMLAIGGLAAAATYGIGLLFGVGLS